MHWSFVDLPRATPIRKQCVTQAAGQLHIQNQSDCEARQILSVVRRGKHTTLTLAVELVTIDSFKEKESGPEKQGKGPVR